MKKELMALLKEGLKISVETKRDELRSIHDSIVTVTVRVSLFGEEISDSSDTISIQKP